MINYNFLQKIYHEVFFKNHFLQKSIFELDKLFFLKNYNFVNNEHVFITSLPRSGTTYLLNLVFSTNKFASLNYSNIPLILSPNISKLLKFDKSTKIERYHKDNIFIDSDSPEAIDEFFFKIFNQKKIKEFRDFINLILISQKKNRYLSKNNLNYKRADFLMDTFPKSLFLIPVRNPLDQSISLLNQHKNFNILQKKNLFLKKYMDYLGHNEFGELHKHWNEPQKFFNPMNLNYWIEQWIFFYTNILTKYTSRKNFHFIFYEDLLNNETIKKLNRFLKIDLLSFSNLNLKFYNNTDFEYDDKIYKEAMEIYTKLKFITNK